MRTMRVMTVLALIALAAGQASAGTNTWTKLDSGNASGSWNTAANPPWSTGALPGTADTADFNTLDITADSTVTLDGNQSVNALIFGDMTTSSAAGWILSAGTPTASTLTLSGTTPAITVNALGTAKAATISAVVVGTAGLTKAGAGTLILSGTNTYSGGTTVNGGRLSLLDISKNTLSGAVSIGSGAILGADTPSGNNVHLLSGNLTLTGGTLAGNGNVSDTANGQFYFDSSTQQLLVSGDVQSAISAEMHVGGTHTFTVADGAAAEDLLVTGKLSHRHGVAWGGIVKAGAGTMHLASSMDGTNSAGTAGIYGLAGFELQAGTLIFDGSLGYSAFAPGSKGGYYLAKFTGPATLKWGVGNSKDVSVNGNLYIGAGVSATLDTDANDVTLGTAIAVGGAGAALVKAGSGSLTLTVTNTYSGGTTINGGTVRINNNGALGGGAVNNAGVLAITNSGVMTFGNAIRGSGGLVKTGAGALTLSGLNTYSGPTMIGGGTLTGVTGGWCVDGPVTVADGATNGIQALIYGTQATCAGLTYAGGTAGLDFDMTTLRVSASVPPLQVNGDLTNNATVNVTVRNGYWPAAGTYPLLGYTGSLNGSGSFNLAGLPPGVSATLNNNTGAKRLELVVTAVPTVSQPLSTWTKLSGGNASGDWVTGDNWSGGVPNATDSVSDFSTLDITASSYVNNDAARTVGTLRFADTTASHNWTVTNAALNLATSLGQPVIAVSNQTATLSSGLSGSQGFVKTGNGTASLAGLANNTLGGSVLVEQGVLKIIDDRSLTNTSASLTVADGAALFIDANYSPEVTIPCNINLSGSGKGADGALGGHANLRLGGEIGLLSNTRITFSLGSIIFYSNVVARAGKCDLEFKRLDSAGSFQINGSMNLGAGRLTVNGNGGATDYTLQLQSGNNTYSGGTVLTNSGTLRLSNNGWLAAVLGGGSMSIYDKSCLDLFSWGAYDRWETVSSLSGPGGLITGYQGSGAVSTSTLEVKQSTDTVFAGVISNSSSRVIALVKTGTGTLSLTGAAHYYTGQTTVSNGMLCVSGALANTPVTVASNAVFSAGVKDGVGQASLGGTLTFKDNSRLAVDVSNGTADKVSVSGNVTIGSNVQLQVSGDQTRGMNQIVVESTGGTLSGDFVLVGGANGVTLTKAGNAVWLRIPPKGTLIRVR